MHLLLGLLSFCFAGLGEDARTIVTRSLGNGDANARLAKSYTYKSREDVRETDTAGRTKVTRSIVREILFIGGKQYSHPIERDGRPLSPDELRQEQEKLNRAVAAANRLTEAQRAQRDTELERERAKERDRLKYIPEAYDFRLLGESTIGGRGVYEIQATPRQEYHGKYENLFRNTKGKLWIDKKDYHWVRIEAEVLDTISFGFFLARVAKGSRFVFEQIRVNDEVWLPRRVVVEVGARLALVKNVTVNEETTFSDYRKFQADSRITSTAEVNGR